MLVRTLRQMVDSAMVAAVNQALQDARLDHRARFVPEADATVDDMIDIVEVEGGSVVGIQLKDGRFGVNAYDLDDDGEVAASTDTGCDDYHAHFADGRSVAGNKDGAP